jgi:hypothetical protein
MIKKLLLSFQQSGYVCIPFNVQVTNDDEIIEGRYWESYNRYPLVQWQQQTTINE